MAEGTFATAVNCMDGRTQIPVIEYMKKTYGVDYVDAVTEPGPIKILAEKRDEKLLESIKRRVSISVEKHGSKVLAIVGHYDCAGNPVEKNVQLEQLEKAVKTVQDWGYGIETIKIWVDENWQVNVV